MHRTALGLAWWMSVAGCSGEDTDTDTGTVVDTDADTDADADSDTDTDADTDSADAGLRVIHVNPALPGQDMLGDGNPGRPALEDVMFGEAWPASGWATRPPGLYTFTFYDHDDDTAWIDFDFPLQTGASHTMVIYGTAKAPDVLALDDDLVSIPQGQVRIRWTHVAPSLASDVLVLEDAAVDRAYGGGVGLAYGTSVEAEEPAEEIQLWVDLDGDGVCDAGEAFEPFARNPGDYFHVLLAEDAKGTLYLQGHARNGETPTRALAACP